MFVHITSEVEEHHVTGYAPMVQHPGHRNEVLANMVRQGGAQGHFRCTPFVGMPQPKETSGLTPTPALMPPHTSTANVLDGRHSRNVWAYRTPIVWFSHQGKPWIPGLGTELDPCRPEDGEVLNGGAPSGGRSWKIGDAPGTTSLARGSMQK